MSNADLPEAYRIGSVPFVHVNIFLDSRPLIPRTETEYWTDIDIKEIRESNIQNPKILDLCAGSGCIGVAVLKDVPSAQVDFVEIDSSHHRTIEKNILENALDKGRTSILGGDLFENVSGSYDFILTNPPYIDPELSYRVGEEVILHEPAKALYGGKGGLEIINKILSQAEKYLKSGGVLYLEHEPEQIEALSKHPLYLDSHNDQFGVVRFSRFAKD